MLVSALHRRQLSEKAEWRADPARRSLPPLDPIPWPEPRALPLHFGSLRLNAAGALLLERRQIAQLHPWQPLRVIRNERTASYSGQTYLVEDLHLLLHGPDRPAALPALRVIDLQLDRS